MSLKFIFVTLCGLVAVSGWAAGEPKHVLVFSKSAGFEHEIVYRDTAWPSFLEQELLELGAQTNIDFVFSKDGTIFTPEEISKYDAFLFYTSGDLTFEPRNGQGDNYPFMTASGKAALLEAVRNGKGFIGIHSAIATFAHVSASNEVNANSNADPYTKMLGAEYEGHGGEQSGGLIPTDLKFPGMTGVSAAFVPIEEWYTMKNFAPDIHVIAALDCSRLAGNLYRRPSFPVVWARLEGKGRVFFSSLGHGEKTWKDPVFRQMILGGIQWASRDMDADITPNLAAATPHAEEIPAQATDDSRPKQ
jgi:hypothetical protein